jgi:predicted Zn-dependent peptidase
VSVGPLVFQRTFLKRINVFVNCGSRSENENTSGTAHFLEHLHFKGSEKRSRHMLELGVENIGGNLNAYTSRENTSYTMQVFEEDLDQGTEILGEMLLKSKYD